MVAIYGDRPSLTHTMSVFDTMHNATFGGIMYF